MLKRLRVDPAVASGAAAIIFAIVIALGLTLASMGSPRETPIPQLFEVSASK